MNDHEFEVVNLMSRFGGSFVKCLAECFYHADPCNFKKLKDAFPRYWSEYEAMLKAERRDNE